MKIFTFVFFIGLSKYGKRLKFIQSIFLTLITKLWVEKVCNLISTYTEGRW